MHRSKQFNYFTKGRDSKEKRKEGLKKAWKWIKAFLYVFIFGLTLTGCIQNFTIKTSSTVGNGFEIYSDKSEIAPRVTTLQDKESSDKSYDFLTTTKINHHVNVKWTDNFIEELSKQTKADGGEYGKYGHYTSSIRVEASNEDNVNARLKELGLVSNSNNIVAKEVNGETRYLFKSDTATGYQRLFNDNILLAYWRTLFDLQKSNKKYQVLTREDGSKYYNILNASFDSVANVKLYDNVSVQDSYATTEEKNQAIEKANKAYASDVLLFMYAYTFGETSAFFKKARELDPSISSTYDFVVKAKDYIDADKLEFKTFLAPNAENLSDYQSKVLAYLEQKVAKAKEYQIQDLEKLEEALAAAKAFDPSSATAFSSDDQTKMNALIKAFATEFNSKVSSFVVGTIDQEVYDHVLQYNTLMKNYLAMAGYSTTTATLVETGLGRELEINSSVLALRGDVAQKSITTWGEAWELGPFYGLLVYPLGKLMQSIRRPMPELNGWASIIAIIIAVIITRALTLALSFRATMMQSLQEDFKSKKAAIEAKYKGFEQNKAMKIRKQQELSALSSKYNINPMDQFGQLFIQMPIFFAIWRVIQGLPEIKSTIWLGLNFSATSYSELFAGNWAYLWILVVAVAVQLVSQLLPQMLNRRRLHERATIAEIEALKKSEKTQKMMMIVFTVITLIFTAGIQVYWMFGGLWQIGQTLSIHYLKKTQWFKNRYSKKAIKLNK
ncbi:membrane protein insertase YidC [Mycoplasmopsis glycophila]|uniref:Putative inner membrane protein translocase component YidC n=1 Tax=Mycoplasmopsis glycophila TaxID=171285 RepID=A0A449AU62_9BACT|nr:membrane protein insertase YidC [Mycoplasmopsis glycophila]VEU70064.1 putative inner membrane protein translocase component YidC [Mycoplasmopsis glycophila]